jgi:SNF2 family DNA or RNA helicase
MITLHALWIHENTLFFWGEEPGKYKEGPSGKGRPPVKPRPHPFCCEAPQVTESLQVLGLRVPPTPGEVRLRLPSLGNSPLPSPSLPVATPSKEARLRPWVVPGAGLEARDAVIFLTGLPRSSRVVVLGDSVTFWSEAAKLALELTLRCRFLPSLERDDGEYKASWKCLPDSENDLYRFRLLVEAMPPLCRSEVLEPGTGTPPMALLHAFLNCSVDSLVRLCLEGAPGIRAPRGGGARAPGMWIRALLDSNPVIKAPQEDLARLATQLAPWLRALEGPADPLRLCLRLSAPGDPESSGWHLEFLLQARDDPSLLIPAQAVWATRDVLKCLGRSFENPQERLLEALGRAARLYPQVAAALETPRPAGIDLDVPGAYVFLRDYAPLLEQAGYSVLLPQWWKSPSSVPALRLKVMSPGAGSQGSFGLDSLVDFSWEIAVGDDTVPHEEFLQMVELKTPLVHLRGRWVELNPGDLENILQFLGTSGWNGRMTAREVLRLKAGTSQALPVPLGEVRAEGWLKEALGDGSERFQCLQEPPGFHGTLRPYQAKGVSWLAFLSRYGLGACLADDMGLGKTIQTLALLLHEKAQSQDPMRVLLVCPVSVMENWRKEADRFAPSLQVHLHHGPHRLKDEDFLEAAVEKDLVITTYSLVLRDVEFLSRMHWGRVVLDEAQNTKNSGAAQTQAVRSLKAGHRIALTGTPVENRLSEVWSIMEFLNPGILGTESRFQRQFAIPIERYRNGEKQTLLKEITGPFMLRRLKTDRNIIQDLPEKIETKVFCHLTREQASLYEAVVQDAMEGIASLDGIQRKGLVLATIMRLKQVCNHPAQLLQDGSALGGRSGKLGRLEEMLEEVIETGDRALIFTQFAQMGTMLKAYLEGRFSREVLYLHGQTSKRERDDQVSRFQGDNGPSLFVLSLKAGGTGLNLTRACQVFHFDRWWNPAVEDQATDRAFRIGQKRNVLVHKYVCRGTLEERIDQMLETKRDLASGILGSGEAWLTELDTEELRRIMFLGEEAVEED